MSNKVKYWFTLSMIEGHLAMWAVRQCPYHRAPGLAEVLTDFERLTSEDFDRNKMAHLSREGMKNLLWVLSASAAFKAWNVPKAEKAKNQEFFTCSAFDKPSPDYDIIDLYALVRNTVSSLFQEAEREDCNPPESAWSKFKRQIFKPRPSLPSTK
jgi:hypothetical protein